MALEVHAVFMYAGSSITAPVVARSLATSRPTSPSLPTTTGSSIVLFPIFNSARSATSILRAIPGEHTLYISVMTLPSLCLLVIFSAETGKGGAPNSGAGGGAALFSSPPSSSASAPSLAPLATLSAAALPARLDALYAQRDDRRVLVE